jgi:hypothetical protein
VWSSRSKHLTLLQVPNRFNQSDTDNWRSSNTPAATDAAAPTASSAATNARQAAPAPQGPSLAILRAEDVGRTKWQPAKDLTSSAQAQQKLRGILNKLTPDNFDRLLAQVRPWCTFALRGRSCAAGSVVACLRSCVWPGPPVAGTACHRCAPSECTALASSTPAAFAAVASSARWQVQASAAHCRCWRSCP